MNFKQTPHPTVEDHHYIQDLINGQEKRSNERAYWQEVEKKRDQFAKDVSGFKLVDVMAFHCLACNKDFTALTFRVIDGWGERAYYKTKHKCGTWCIRHVTNRELDPYFLRSKVLAQSRGLMHNETLQPWEIGYNTLYKQI